MSALEYRVKRLEQLLIRQSEKSLSIDEMPLEQSYKEGMYIAVYDPILEKTVKFPFTNQNQDLSGYQLLSEIDTANGYVGLDNKTKIGETFIPDLPISRIVNLQSKLDKGTSSISITGDTNKILTLTRFDGTTITESFTDVDTDTNVFLNGLNFNTSNGTFTAVLNDTNTSSVSLDGRYSLLGHDHHELYNTKSEITSLLEGKEGVFTKNTAFNKDFGTTVGTVAQGNDDRIINGQTAFDWGNHANSGYLTKHQSLSGYATELWVDNLIPQVVTKNFVNGLNIDADKLDGLNSSDFVRKGIDGANCWNGNYLIFGYVGENNVDAISFNDANNAFYFNADKAKTNTGANAKVYAGSFYEGGVGLSSKYLGKNAKAADSDNFDGLDSTNFIKDTGNGNYTFSNLPSNTIHRVHSEDGSPSSGYHTVLKIRSDYGFELSSNTNATTPELYYRALSTVKSSWKKIYHEGNFGKTEINALNVNAATLGYIDSDRFIYGDNSRGTINTYIEDGGIGADAVRKSGFFRDNNSNFSTLGIHVQHTSASTYALQIGSASYSRLGNLQYRLLSGGKWTSEAIIRDTTNFIEGTHYAGINNVNNFTNEQIITRDTNNSIQTILKFNTTRPWEFRTDNKTADTKLILKDTTGDKIFRIEDGNGTDYVEFLTGKITSTKEISGNIINNTGAEYQFDSIPIITLNANSLSYGDIDDEGRVVKIVGVAGSIELNSPTTTASGDIVAKSFKPAVNYKSVDGSVGWTGSFITGSNNIVVKNGIIVGVQAL